MSRLISSKPIVVIKYYREQPVGSPRVWSPVTWSTLIGKESISFFSRPSLFFWLCYEGSVGERPRPPKSFRMCICIPFDRSLLVLWHVWTQEKPFGSRGDMSYAGGFKRLTTEFTSPIETNVKLKRYTRVVPLGSMTHTHFWKKPDFCPE